MTTCPSCGAEVRGDARFCAACGTVLVGACPSCGSETRVGERFCSVCGHRLDLAAPKEEERKLVTVLFADLTGSTTLGEQLDPERLRTLLQEYFSAMAEVVEARGGTVEKFIGDAVMAVFGIPAMHEDDAERALHAALDMHARLDSVNDEIERAHGVRLAMRIGVNTGEVIAGAGGEDLMVTGDPVNVAARLQQTAEPGEVVAGDRTFLAARHAFAFEPLEEKVLKGKSAPVAAWRVAGATEPLPRSAVGLFPRLVGRARELEVLETLYRSVVEDSRPRLVTVLGDAGVGKSRLTEEFVAHAGSGDPPAAVFRGRCLAYGQGITFFALKEILWSAAGILLDDPASLASEKLEKFARSALDRSGIDPDEADRVLFALAMTAGIALPENPLERMSPESVGEELALAWPRLLSALAADRPAVVVVDDIHWAETPLLDMAERLVARTTGPVLILATARPEFAEVRSGWSGRAGMSQLALQPLTDADARELLGEALPAVGAGLRDRILASAEGNPFFAEEIVRHLLDRGVLVHGPDGIAETSGDGAVAIPDTVRALLAARIDALPSEEKRVLQDAAVVGRVFWAPALEAIGDAERLRPTLRSLEDRGLFVTRPSSSLPGQLEMAFNHALSREVAYESIPRARRARVHTAVAGWIETLAGDRRMEFVDLVSHHYASAARPEDADLAWPAGDPERERVRAAAVASLVEAGSAAKQRYAIDQAIGLAERALALSTTPAERLSALELKALAAHAGLRGDAARGAYVEALDEAAAAGDRDAARRLGAQATLLWTRYGGILGADYWKPKAAELIRQGLEADGEEAVTPEAVALLVGRAAARHYRILDRTAAASLADAERAVEVADALDDTVLQSYALESLMARVSEEGFCRLDELGERSIRLARSMEDRLEAHETFVNAADAFVESERFDRAEEAAEEAVRRGADLSPHHKIHGIYAKTRALFPRGNIAGVIQASERLEELIEEDGGRMCGNGEVAMAGRALALFESGSKGPVGTVTTTRATDNKTMFGRASQYQVLELLSLTTEPDQALHWLDGIGPPDSTLASLFRLRAEIPLLALARSDDRLDGPVAEARRLAGPACAPYLGWLADWADAVRLAERGRGREAVALVRSAWERLRPGGERYAPTRRMADLLPLLDPASAKDVAGELLPQLDAMGAQATAANARAFL